MKKSLCFLLVLCFFGMVQAEPVSKDYAAQIALNYFKHYAPSRIQDYTISNTGEYLYQGQTTMYLFNFTSGGFVLLAADDACIPILGYSSEGSLKVAEMPANVKAWLDDYSREIDVILDAGLSNAGTKNEWTRIYNNDFTKDIAAVTPLLSTTWDQGCYYNASCPYDAGGDCSHALTGCVATATAQVMKFWNYPTTGLGSHSYSDPTYGTQSANFGTTTYQWASMPANVTTTNTAVATLMKHCGVGVDMSYGVSGSSATTADVPYALINYFRYDASATYKYKSSYTAAGWISLLKAELDAARPVIYRGDDGSSGHAFVCDGYNNSNYFHFNWGWSGYADGYFVIGSLNPGTYAFNSANAAVIYISPPGTQFNCNTAATLACIPSFSGTTVGGNSVVDLYSCSSWDESGPEKIHTITTTTSGNISATLSNISVDLDVFILSGCDKSSCVASGDVTATYASAPAGTYYVVVDGSGGVSGSYTLTFSYPGMGTGTPVSNFTTNPTSIHQGASIHFMDQSTNTPTSWTWTFGDGAMSTLQNPYHTYTSAGTFTAKLKASNSCGNNTKTKTIVVVNTSGTDEMAFDETLKLMPNPASNSFEVSYERGFKPGTTLDIADVSGKIVKHFVLNEMNNHVDISDLVQGFYVVKIQSGSMTCVKKIVKL